MLGLCLYVTAAGVLSRTSSAQTASALGTDAATARRGAVDPRLVRATEALEAGRAAAALELAQAVEREHPETPGLHYVLGSALYRMGRMVPAERALRLAVAEDASNVEAMRLLGLVLYRLGRPKDALGYLERTQGTDGGDSDAAFVLGMCYVDTNDLNKARVSFASQYGYATESAAAYLLAGQLLLRANLQIPAQGAGEQALARSPHLPLAQYLLGEIALARQDFPHALEHFRAEIENNPGYARTYDRLGDTFLRQNDLRRAQEALNRAIILDPAQTGPYILLGKLMLRKADPATAILYLRRAERMDGSNYMTHALLGQALRATKQVEEAARETQMAVDLQHAEAPKLETLQ